MKKDINGNCLHLDNNEVQTIDLPYEPDEMVLSCAQLERDLSFQLDGAHCCCRSTVMGPLLFDIDEIESGKIDHAEIVKRRKRIFECLNTNDTSISCYGCGEVIKKKFKDVRLDQVGGCAINIQHYTQCNLKCSYCIYAKKNRLIPPTYSAQKIIEIFKCFEDKDKIVGGSWVQISGGEPALLTDLGELLYGLVKLKLGEVCIFSNSSKHSEVIEAYLRNNSMHIVTSIDAGIPSTFKKIRGGQMQDVIDTLVKYRKTNTTRLYLKYIITEDNCNEDDLFAFVSLMLALRPDRVYIIPDYPYSEAEIPYESIVFGARLWYLLRKYSDIHVHIQSDDVKADSKFVRFSADIRKEFNRICAENPLTDEYILLRGVGATESKAYDNYKNAMFNTCIMSNLDERGKIALWGFGEIGRAFCHDNYDIKNNISVIIDKNENIHGTKPLTNSDVTIEAPEYLLENHVDAIIITTANYVNEIEEYINSNIKYKVRVISSKKVYELNS